MQKLVDYIKKNNLGEIVFNKKFKDITTLKIGGKIKLLYYPNSIENFIHIYKLYFLNMNMPLIIIGNGSNVLANSSDFNGIVVSFKKILYKYSVCGNIVHVSSGVMIMDLIKFLKSNNISGLEKLSGIPATIGGMVKMNAGAYGVNISDYLVELKIIDKSGTLKCYKKEDLAFSYRKCNIDEKDIILECVFKLNNKEEKEIKRTIEYIVKKRIENQPLDKYNAGSTFKNPESIKIWKLIDEAGLRGFNINDARISEKHCNFFINSGNCESKDMIQLINYAKKTIEEKYNISLECEWIFINF